MSGKRAAGVLLFLSMTLGAVSLSAGQVAAERLNYKIILPENPSAVCKLAASELAFFLEKTYAEPIKLNGSDGPVVFYAGVSGEAVMDGFCDLPEMRGSVGVFRKGRSILFHGWDDKDLDPEKQTVGEAGTLLSVYYFLSKYAGVGFYFPGENGFSIAKEKALPFPSEADITAPSFEMRGFSMATKEFSWKDLCLFFRRSLCSVPKWGKQDIYYIFMHNWKKRFWESHPEYFMMRDGKRVAESYPLHIPCFTNPEVAKRTAADIIEDLNKNPSKTTVKLFCDAPMHQCQCDTCKASPERKYAGNDIGSCEEFYGFQKRVADIVRQSHPDVYFLTQTKSESYFKPPRLVKLGSLFTVSVLTYQHSTKASALAPAVEAAKAWKAAGVRTTIFSYPRYSDGPTKNLPVITPKFLSEYFNAFNGITCGTDISELNFNPYSFSALNQFVQARLLFDVRADVAALTKEFCAFAYPGAEKEMVEFYDVMENLYRQRKSVAMDPFIDIYDTANLDKPARLLDEAKKKSPGSAFLEKLHADFKEVLGKSREAKGKSAEFRKRLDDMKKVCQRPAKLKADEKFADFDATPDKWKGAVKYDLSHLMPFKDPQASSIYFACDGKNLLLGLVAMEKNTAGIAAKCQADGPVSLFGDDCFEIMLFPPDTEAYHQIGVNSAGFHTVLDRSMAAPQKLSANMGFKLETKASVLDGKWVAKAKIPLAQFDPVSLKKPWRFNVFRTRLAGGSGESYGVALLSSGYHENFEFAIPLSLPAPAGK